MVLFSESDFYELIRQADLGKPALPAPDADGNRSADEYSAVWQARANLRPRRRLGLSQAELARLAVIRPETLNRTEQSGIKPSVPTIAKIDRA
jgi:hypothetical protein